MDSKRNITANARSRRHELLLSRGDGGESSMGEPSVEAQKANARTGTRYVDGHHTSRTKDGLDIQACWGYASGDTEALEVSRRMEIWDMLGERGLALKPQRG